ncbi:MAG: hypothetical protein KAR40_09630 [Candidatus Sabulitectum sp.]|nr:hypothetical protein [Candidatus Sabulitectum sp.]
MSDLSFDNLPKENLVNVLIKWSSLTGTDEGKWAKVATMADKTVHIFGEFDGAAVIIQGSNEGGRAGDTPNAANAVTLVDPQGNQISVSSKAMETILENPAQIRPVTSGGGASTDITVIICAKGGLQ